MTDEDKPMATMATADPTGDRLRYALDDARRRLRAAVTARATKRLPERVLMGVAEPDTTKAAAG